MGVPAETVASLLERAFKERIIPAVGKEMERMRDAKVWMGRAYFFLSHMEQERVGNPIYIEGGGKRRKVVGYEVRMPVVTPLFFVVEGRKVNLTVVWVVRAEVWTGVEGGDPPAVREVKADAVQVEGSPLRCPTPLLLATTGMKRSSIKALGLPSIEQLDPSENDIRKVAHYFLLHLDDSWIGLRLVGEKLASAFADVASRLGTLKVQNALRTSTGYYTIEKVKPTPKIVVDYYRPPAGRNLPPSQAATTYIVTFEMEGTLKVRLEYENTDLPIEMNLPLTFQIEWRISEPITPPPEGRDVTVDINATLQITQIPPNNSHIGISCSLRRKVVASDQRISLLDILPSTEELEKTFKYLLQHAYDDLNKAGFLLSYRMRRQGQTAEGNKGFAR